MRLGFDVACGVCVRMNILDKDSILLYQKSRLLSFDVFFSALSEILHLCIKNIPSMD